VIGLLAGKVTGLEQDADLLRLATELVPVIAGRRADIVQGSLADGHRAGALYDVIFVNGAIAKTPDSLLAQLADGGRLVAIIQTGAQGMAVLFEANNGHIGRRSAFDASAPLLAGFERPTGFVF
jgi:protein-L-isoaspartate(D-aspartate) O-methyltransferase